MKIGRFSLLGKSKLCIKSATVVVAATIGAIHLAKANSTELPPVCDDYANVGKLRIMMLAKIAFNEATRKKIKIKRYNSIFVRVIPEKEKSDGMHVKKGPHFSVTFSVFDCESLGLDGGSFDVKIEPITFRVMQSRFTPN